MLFHNTCIQKHVMHTAQAHWILPRALLQGAATWRIEWCYPGAVAHLCSKFHWDSWTVFPLILHGDKQTNEVIQVTENNALARCRRGELQIIPRPDYTAPWNANSAHSTRGVQKVLQLDHKEEWKCYKLHFIFQYNHHWVQCICDIFLADF